MPLEIGAAAYVGIAFETTSGTYEPPTKFFPIRSESLQWTQETNFRRVIRGTADPIGAIAGNGNVEGDIDMELLDDVVPYFLAAARTSVTKTGAEAPYTYEFVGAHGALPSETLSITVVRAGQVFGYVGCVVGSMSFSVDNDMGVVTFSIVGTAEDEQAEPSLVYGDDLPFGSGKWNIQLPTNTQIFTVDTFSLEIEDNAEAQNRLKDELGAQFVKFGERTTTVSLDQDFVDRTEYNMFKLLTARSVTIEAAHSAERSVTFQVPVGYYDSYESSVGSVGDLVRASTSIQGTHDPSIGGSYKITVVTSEDVEIGS